MTHHTPRRASPGPSCPTPGARRDVGPDAGDDEPDDAVIATALRWSAAVAGVVLLAAAIVVFCWRRPAVQPPRVDTPLASVAVRETPRALVPTVHFTDITQAAGIGFRHENGARGRKLLPETMGGGCAFFDPDADGDQDLLLVNGQPWPWDGTADPASAASVPAAAPTLSLYRNDGSGRFDDITAGSGLAVSLYGTGVAAGDYDNDGRTDLYVAAVGANKLFHNEGGGRFRDVTDQAQVAGGSEEWTTSCGWLDYDNDGDLDLFAVNYVQWSREFDEAQNFQLTGGGRAYGRPQNFAGTFPYLFRNEGNGCFREVSASAGLQVRNPATDVPLAKSLGTTFADFDDDGRIDIVVANDTVQNLLFHNQGDGRFQEIGALAGVAFDAAGNARGAMGIDAARFRDSGAVGVAIGNFANEMTALYVSAPGQMQFVDEAVSSGLGPRTRLELTFGVFYFDFDLDGRLDLFAANGHLEQEINRVQPSQHYEQPPHLFWNCGPAHDAEFLPVAAAHCGDDLLRPLAGRGAAYADIDGDGDLDLLVTASGQPPRLLRNELPPAARWLRLQLRGTRCNRDGIGAWIDVTLSSGVVLRRQVMPTRSYLSQVELPVTIGLGAAEVQQVLIRWPDGARQIVSDWKLKQTHVVEQSLTDSEQTSEQ